MKKNKKLIIGLGNEGDEYESTRHNAGFMLIDYLLDQFDSSNKIKLKNSSAFKISDNLLLAKTKTFMSGSGGAIREAVKWFDVGIEEELILAHDDLDIPLGKFKLQQGKSPVGHNGVLSVEKALGTTRFQRLRIGIENRSRKNISGSKYVMSKFSEEELISLKETFEQIRKRLVTLGLLG